VIDELLEAALESRLLDRISPCPERRETPEEVT
jgi:hypothetical protein